MKLKFVVGKELSIGCVMWFAFFGQQVFFYSFNNIQFCNRRLGHTSTVTINSYLDSKNVREISLVFFMEYAVR